MVEEAEAMKSNDADYAEKLAIKHALEEAAYDLPEDECDEITMWLHGLSLESTPIKKLEQKLAAVQKKL